MNRFAFRNFLLRLTFTLAVVIAARPAAATSFWISADQFERLHVVVGADDSEPEQIAARRFAEHWRLTTGFTPTQSNEAMVGSVNVWIGDAVRRAFPAEFGRRVSSTEGCFILTLASKDRSGGQGDLLIAGGDPRGTLRAEWAFFERFLGARAYAPGVLKFPAPRKGIPSIDWRDEPDFEYRDTNYRAFLNNPWLASLNDLNGQWSAVPERFGGHIAFVRGLAGHGHTFHDFVNPEEYFGAHPEYFAEIEGERVKEA
ncbi:MAG: DUF4838 domain-containing protein, partial [Bryobacteraceae bacterium]